VSASPGKIRSLQALRGVAVLMVVLTHIAAPFGTETHYLHGQRIVGWLQYPTQGGVDLFFVISGVIITVTTWRTFGAPGSVRRFAYRRVTRIYPLYLLVTAAVLIVWLHRHDLVNSHSPYPTRVLQSFLILPQRGDPLVATGWTLVYELYFYLVFGLALLLPRRRLGWVMAAWLAIAALVHFAFTPTSNAWLAMLGNLVVIEFVFGVAIGWLVMRGVMVAPRALAAIGVAGVAGGVAALAARGSAAFPSIWFEVFVTGLAMTAIVYAAIGLEVRFGARSPRSLVFVGDASYSVYLIHVAVLGLIGLGLEHVVGRSLPVHALALVVLAAAGVAAGLLLYRLVEEPLLRAFHTRLFNTPLAAPREPQPQAQGWRPDPEAAI